jgi:hypothetical protein
MGDRLRLWPNEPVHQRLDALAARLSTSLQASRQARFARISGLIEESLAEVNGFRMAELPPDDRQVSSAIARAERVVSVWEAVSRT